MNKLGKQAIRNKLIVTFTLILIVPSILIGWISYHSAKAKVEEQIINAAEQNVDLINQNVNLFFEDRIKIVDYLSLSISANEVNSTIVSQLKHLLETYPDTQEFYIGMKTGELFSSSGKLLGNPKGNAWYDQAMTNPGKAIISDPIVDKQTNQVLVTIAKTLPNNTGVVAFDVKIEELATMVNKAKIGTEGYPQVLDRNSKFLVHPKQPVGADAANEEHKYMFQNETGSISYLLDGEEKKLMFVTNDLTGWKISGTMYSAEIVKEAQPILKTTMIVILIALVLAGIVVYLIIRSIIKPLKRLMVATENINNGDLGEKIEVKSKDEFGQLSISFNDMVQSLRSILEQVNKSAMTLTASSEELTANAEQSSLSAQQIAAATQQMVAGSEEQLNSINGAVSSINRMSAEMQQIAAHSEEVTSLTQNTLELTAIGSSSVKDVIVHMNDMHETVQNTSEIIGNLGNRSEEIAQIVSLITDIASQTNLLALNAAIEAARAGEHGKGFAVVADEVRKLAEQSSSSASQISELIMMIQKETASAVVSMSTGTEKVEQGVERTQKFGQLFHTIDERVSVVNDRVEEVANSITHISAGAQNILEAIEVVREVASDSTNVSRNNSKISDEQLSAIEDVAASAQSLAELAEEMQMTLGKFKL